ncbi:processed acidic surface protein [Neobacillus sp. LXY-4]|uniref:processed acidic surface protein n=1 Tax=Neobacillus sp. LXY-4 TaxID=3379826 RepID=UPI003EDF661A
MKKIIKVLLALMLIASFFPNLSFAAQEASFDTDLEAYLKEVSEIRGFDVTREDIELVLSYYEDEIANFSSVDELSEALGEVIKADYSNLTPMLEEYGLTMDELIALLDENGESLDDYVYVADLDSSVYFYLNLWEDELGYIDEEFINQLLTIFEEEFGLTQQEVQNLTDHFTALESKLSAPETLAQIEALGERMAAFAEFESLDDLSADQIKDFLSIYNEFLDILELKIDFALIKNNEESPMNIWDVMNLKELTNAKLKISIYDKNDKFLADLIITGEMVDSGTVVDIGEQIDKAAEETAKEVAKAPQPEVKTVKGGKLPNTAGNYATNLLVGCMMILLGAFVYRTSRKVS